MVTVPAPCVMRLTGSPPQSETMLPGAQERSARDSCGSAATAALPASVSSTAARPAKPPPPPPPAGAGNLALPFGHGAALERSHAAQRHQGAVAPGGVRHNELLDGPIAGEIR